MMSFKKKLRRNNFFNYLSLFISGVSLASSLFGLISLSLRNFMITILGLMAAFAIVTALVRFFARDKNDARLLLERYEKSFFRTDRAERRAPNTVPAGSVSKDGSANSSTVIATIASNKIYHQRTASLFIAATIVAHLVISNFQDSRPSILVLFLMGFALATINSGVVATEYRIRNGLYGSNEYEAREIVRFVLKHQDDIDFSGGLGAGNLKQSHSSEHAADGLVGVQP